MPNEILRKITIKNCGFPKTEVRQLVTAENPVANLIKIMGITSSANPGQTDNGEYLRLFGQFRAVNMQTGEEFDSSQCILPSFISDSIADALSRSSEVEFALMIGAKYEPTSVTEYVFTVTPLIEPKVSDKMAALLAVSDAYVPPALPAPKAEASTKPAAKAKKAA